MRLAIMQPYLFPYLGYFQLMRAVDRFVAYDDVAFIKQGWINRNYILVNQGKHLFTVPIRRKSSFLLINEAIVSDVPAKWETKLFATLAQTYSKAPYFGDVFPLLETTLTGCAGRRMSDVAIGGLCAVWRYLGLPAPAMIRSSWHSSNGSSGAARVIDICKRERATVYVNSIGGQDLYNKSHFASHGIELAFLRPSLPEYRQFSGSFVAGLSIIDILMFNSPAAVRQSLDAYELS